MLQYVQHLFHMLVTPLARNVVCVYRFLFIFNFYKIIYKKKKFSLFLLLFFSIITVLNCKKTFLSSP